MRKFIKKLGYKPIISVIMPVFNTSESYLNDAITSVINQTYPYWELCIADDASTHPKVLELLKHYASQDSRIKVLFRKNRGHISLASNSALEIASGEFIALLDHDDLLPPHALYEMARFLNDCPHADMIYSDEDKIDEKGRLITPFFKPDWCHDTFMCTMYTLHLGVYRTRLVRQLGGFRSGYEGCQDWDLVLRLSEVTKNIFHIPMILYHWRMHNESTAKIFSAKQYGMQSARKALSEALNRRGEKGLVQTNREDLNMYLIRYKITDYALISIIITIKDFVVHLDQCLNSIFKESTYPNYEVVLVYDKTVDARILKVIDKWKNQESSRLRAYALDAPCNNAKLKNYGAEKSNGYYLLFLDSSIQIAISDWMECLVEYSQRPSIGAIGVLLLSQKGFIQHAGILLNKHSVAVTDVGDSGWWFTPHNVSAVSDACLMCRRDVYKSGGGYNENLNSVYSGIDFCLRILEKGYENIYLSNIYLYHHVSKAASPTKNLNLLLDARYMKRRWKTFLDQDRCYNKNLTEDKSVYSVKKKNFIKNFMTVLGYPQPERQPVLPESQILKQKVAL